MQTNDTQTPAWLEPCPSCSDHIDGRQAMHQAICPDCQGTGLRYWMLSTECPTCWKCHFGRSSAAHRLSCKCHGLKYLPNACDGTGRIEITGPEAVAALLEVLLERPLGREVMFWKRPSGKYWTVTASRSYEGDTLEAALKQALAAATEAPR